jgi:hypothetical protein
LKKFSFGCHFGRKRREKSRETSVKFENLEEKMSKWTGLNKQTKNLSKFEEKKNFVRFSGRKAGKNSEN